MMIESVFSGSGGGRGSRCGRPPSAISSRDGRDTPLRRATPTSQDGRYRV